MQILSTSPLLPSLSFCDNRAKALAGNQSNIASISQRVVRERSGVKGGYLIADASLDALMFEPSPHSLMNLLYSLSSRSALTSSLGPNILLPVSPPRSALLHGIDTLTAFGDEVLRRASGASPYSVLDGLTSRFGWNGCRCSWSMTRGLSRSVPKRRPFHPRS